MKPLFLLMLVLAAVMPSVPEPTDLLAVAFVVVAGLLLFLWVAQRIVRGTFPNSSSGFWLTVFLALVLVSALTASLFGTPIDLWLRGAIPFLFLFLFFPALDIARRDPHWILDAVHLSSIAWLINTAIAAGDAVPAVLSGDVQRITHATEAWAAFQLPYAMVGLALTLFHPPRWARRFRWPLAALFSFVPFLAVSRGQIVAVIAIWIFYMARLPKAARIRAAFPAMVIALGAVLVLSQSELSQSIIERFAETGSAGGGSRLVELRYAFEQFLASPLLGKGLGHQIPADITFSGDWEMIVMAGVDSVGYMHNVIGYVLMDLGLAGLLAYLGFIVSALWQRKWGTSPREEAARRAGLVIVLVLFGWWFMIQPSFRHIQANLLLAAAIAVLCAMKKPAGAVAHARPA